MKILIFGIVASGKTTLAQKLSNELKVPYYEGDNIAWGFPKEKRYKRSNEEQEEIIEKINKKGNWIVEGTYRESQKVLYKYADKIIFLDTPLYIRKFRIVYRFIKQQLGIEKCNYKSDFNMLKHMFKWSNDFENKRKEYEERLMEYSDKLIWIKNSKELDGNYKVLLQTKRKI